MFGLKIKSLRENREIKIKEMASYFDVNETTYGKWEKEQRTPDIYTVKKIANFFNVSIDYLLDNETGVKNTPLSKDIQEIVTAMENSDSDIRNRMNVTLKSAFPEAFAKPTSKSKPIKEDIDKYSYEWALGVLERHDMQLFNFLKDDNSKISKEDIIKIAKGLED